MGFGLMNIGASGLLANQAALQTTGHNIANVNTAGYSRQSTVQTARDGMFSGGGYLGRGVDVATVARVYDNYLATTAIQTQSQSSADAVRSASLSTLERLFPVGEGGLGSTVNAVFTALSDLSSMPQDSATRTTMLARLSDLASHFNTVNSQLDDMQSQLNEQLNASVVKANQLATQVAQLNAQIQGTAGTGQSPNDLLDRRDQAIFELSQSIQITKLANSDGTVSVFVGGGQPLVTGVDVAPLRLQTNPADPLQRELFVRQTGQDIGLSYQSVAGGELGGLLRFQTQDLEEARNTMGRLALGVATVLNNQQKLGVDARGQPGQPLFALPSVPGRADSHNTGNAAVSASFADTTGIMLQPSDYEVNFTSGTAGSITRLSDGTVVNFSSLPTPASPLVVDGLSFSLGAGASAGDRYTLKPGSVGASLALSITTAQQIAATPVSYAMGDQNQGSLAVTALRGLQASPTANGTQVNPALTAPVTLTFTGPTTYTVSGTGTGNTTGNTYTPGTPIMYNGWTINLSGTPQPGDTVSIGGLADTAQARTPLLQGVSLADGYAAAIASFGSRVQSAKSAAKVSDAMAAEAKLSATASSGVNLDEEAAKLLQYQQSYQASAKVLQVAQTIFDSLLQATSR